VRLVDDLSGRVVRRDMLYDLVLRGGMVVDGTGNPAVEADVGIKDARIAHVGHVVGPAKRSIDIAGLVLAPGFIDMHSHTDMSFLSVPDAATKIEQGVTTEVVGECGISPAPVSETFRDELKKYAFEGAGIGSWTSFDDYLKSLESKPLSTNIVQLVGQGTVRIAIMGLDSRLPSKQEMTKMKALVADALSAGAYGLSTGLIYPPGEWSDTEELLSLLQVVAHFSGGYYNTHVRGEGHTVIEGWQEAIELGNRADIPVQISHAKAAGRENWGKSTACIALVEDAQTHGLDVSFDCYPFTRTGGSLSTLLPNWLKEGGADKLAQRLSIPKVRKQIRMDIRDNAFIWNPIGYSTSYLSRWDTPWLLIAAATQERHRDMEGRTMLDIAASLNKDPLDVIFDMLIEGDDARVVLDLMDEEDVRNFVRSPRGMIGTDCQAFAAGAQLSEGSPHPRCFSTFPRVLAKYVKDEHVLSLEQAIQKMTGLAAKRIGLSDRGIIAQGNMADLVTFSPEHIQDQATFSRAWLRPLGIHHVIVNGSVCVEDGQFSGDTAGRVLRRTDTV